MLRFPLLAFFLGLLALPSVGYGQNGGEFDPAQATYLWPTNASKYMSSTFGETRASHFHAALDLKTWGRRGYNVYATRDGLLHRIAIGPKGYGKVVYLKHEDGSYSLYAHLLRFENNIQQIADSIRMQDYSFELDMPLDSLGIQVKQGDLIGLSGASGIGPPHIHFELRTPNEKPFNPLLTNLRVHDTIAPRFVRLSVEPLSMFTKVEDKAQLFVKRARKRNDTYTFGTIDVEGPVGLGVDVYDQANDVYNSYAVYELEMHVNDQLLFHSKVDSFAYHETDQMFLDRVYPILKETRAGFQRLYVTDGNTLPFYSETGYSGKLNMEEGVHRVRIVARDYYGNTREASLRLRVHSTDTQATPVPRYAAETGLPELLPSDWGWFDNWVTIPSPALNGLTVSPLGAKTDMPVASENTHSVNIDLNRTRDVFFRRHSRDHFIARRVYPDAFSIVPATTHDIFATFGAGTVYDTLSVGITSQVHRADSIQVNVFPGSHPIRQPFKLSYAADSTLRSIPNLAFYAYNKRRDRLSHIETHQIGSHLVAYPKSLGTFYALSDTTSPVLSRPRISQQPDGHWVVTVKVHDNLSGLDYKKSVMSVNGVRGIAEFEPEDNQLLFYHPSFKPETSNTIEVTVYDKLGNKSHRTFVLDPES